MTILYYFIRNTKYVKSQLVAEFKESFFISNFFPASIDISGDSIFAIGFEDSMNSSLDTVKEINIDNGNIVNEFKINKTLFSDLETASAGGYQFSADDGKLYFPNALGGSLEVYSSSGVFLRSINNIKNNGFSLVKNQLAYVRSNISDPFSISSTFTSYNISKNISIPLFNFEKNNFVFPESQLLAGSLDGLGNIYFNLITEFGSSTFSVQVNKITNGGINIPLSIEWLNISTGISFDFTIDDELLYMPVIQTVQVYDLIGNLLLEFGMGNPLIEATLINSIVAKNRTVYISDIVNQRILAWEIKNLTDSPSTSPTKNPSISPSMSPTKNPSISPSFSTTTDTTLSPTTSPDASTTTSTYPTKN